MIGSCGPLISMMNPAPGQIVFKDIYFSCDRLTKDIYFSCDRLTKRKPSQINEKALALVECRQLVLS